MGRRIVAPRALEDRVDGAAESGTQHQRQCGKRRDEMRVGQRHDQQHAGDAGMHHPGDDGADQDAEHGIAGDRIHEDAGAGRIFRRRQRIEQDMQRQQHQSEPDRDAADVLDARPRAAAEGDEADDEQHRCDGGDVERQNLHDQRGADVGPEHDRQRRHQADQAFGSEGTGDQCGRRAALEQRGQAEPGAKGGEAVVERFRQQEAQVGTECAQGAAVDHMQAPQQQRHAAHSIEKNHGSHAHAHPESSRTVRLSANAAGSTPDVPETGLNQASYEAVWGAKKSSAFVNEIEK